MKCKKNLVTFWLEADTHQFLQRKARKQSVEFNDSVTVSILIREAIEKSIATEMLDAMIEQKGEAK